MSTGIYTAISNIMKDCPTVGKDSKNKQQGFQYRGIDAVYNALQPVFAKHGVFSVPEVLEESYERVETKSGGMINFVRLKIKYTFFAEDGSSVSSTVIGEAMDAGDKACNKAMAVGHKYAITQLMKLPFASDDPDAESHTMSDSSDGVYRVPFGKHKNKTIDEIGIDEAFSYASFLHKKNQEDGKDPSQDTQHFFDEVKKARAPKGPAK